MSKFALAVLLLTSVRAFAAGGVNDMYPHEALVMSQGRCERQVGKLFSYGLWEVMNGTEKRALSGVRIEVPLKGNGPLDAFSYTKAGVPTVVIPVLSLKFIEDLSVVYAWRHVSGYSLQPIDIYLAMLKYRRPADFPGGRIPDPLTALGVPPHILNQDKSVNALSLRFRNSAWSFILAHELGHLRFGHPGNKQVPPEVSQRNEMEADDFAVSLLSRSDTIPMGMILWFKVSIAYFKNRADFCTDAAYREWMLSEATHPVSPERLLHLAKALNQAAQESLSPEKAKAMRFIAGKSAEMAKIVSDPDIQRLIVHCAVFGCPKDLKRLHGSPCDDRLK
jgi:hypothetical protein